MRTALQVVVALLAASPLATAAQQASSHGTAPATSKATARPVRVLVFDFTTQGEAAASLRRVLSDSAARELARLEGTQVLTQADIAAQLGDDVQRPTGSCADDRACMAEIAGSLDADRTLAGTVTLVGDTTIVAVTLLDARRMSTLGGAQEAIKGAQPEQLIDAARRLAYRAFTGKLLETTGAIEFDVPEPGARVILDGEEIGQGPLRASRRAPEGLHRVLVVKEGFATWETELRIAAGATSSVAPRLAAMPPGYAKPPRAPGPWYAEARLEFAWELKYETVGTTTCIDAISASFCGGPLPSLRAGYRLDDAWSVEVAGSLFSLPKSDPAAGYVSLGGFGLGAAAAWYPMHQRWLGLAAEAGFWRATAEAANDNGGEKAAAWRAYGAAEGRLDLPLDVDWSFGLRAGAVWIAPGAAVSYTFDQGGTPKTLGIPSDSMLLFAAGFGFAYRL